MNILYYGMSGSAANPNTGWMWIIIGTLVTIISIIIITKTCLNDDWLVLLAIPVAFIIIGIFNFIDSRRPYIQATLDDTVSFIELQDKYELTKKEGQLYTFKVLNVDLDEWEVLVKEKNN